MQSGWNAAKLPASPARLSEVDLLWFIRAIKCPVVGKLVIFY